MGINLRFWKRKSPADKAVEKVSKLPSKSKIIALILLVLVLSSGVSASSIFLYNKYFVSKARTSLEIQFGKMKEGAAACGKFVVSYGLFYEKAVELFANGTTGCAIKYLKNGKPSDMPNGCWKLDAFRVQEPYQYVVNSRWQQDPDTKYYNSLKKLYDRALSDKEDCESVAGGLDISFDE